MQAEITDVALDSYINLIEYASRIYAKKVRSPYLDEKDFFGEGVILLTLCWKKWNGSEQDFGKYFKTSLFTNFNLIAQRQRQKESCFCPLEKDEMPLPIAVADDGFREVAFRELCNYVASGLEQPDRTIFVLLADPPQQLCRIALLDSKKMERKALLGKKSKVEIKSFKRKGSGKLVMGFTRTDRFGYYSKNKVRLNAKHILTYLNNRGFSFTEGQYRFALKRIRKRVERVIQDSRPSLTV